MITMFYKNLFIVSFRMSISGNCKQFSTFKKLIVADKLKIKAAILRIKYLHFNTLNLNICLHQKFSQEAIQD
jgi:hypothetical protein